MFNLAQKRMDFTFDENGICSTKWTSSSQVNMSDELFDCFINMINLTNEVTNDLYQMQWINPPRLKSGSESGSESGGSSTYTCKPSYYNRRIQNCVVQSLYKVLHEFGSSHTLQSIDNWLCSNNYYEYRGVSGWGVKLDSHFTVLSHFLSGGAVTVNLSNLTNSGSSKCILILNRNPIHVVVYNFYAGPSSLIHYYSQGEEDHTCSIEEISAIFKATM
jgi:hypothetical protein